MDKLTPRKTVEELDKYIIGQNSAKKAVAIALRNRWRRQMLSGDMKDEILPKNILMIGPTGVGKTEIARRLARLAQAPFIKVEASKFTEVGYVGRDVESMIRDLTALALNMVKKEEFESVQEKARMLAEEKILDLLLPPFKIPENSKDENSTDTIASAKKKTGEKPEKSLETSSERESLKTDILILRCVKRLCLLASYQTWGWTIWRPILKICSEIFSRRNQRERRSRYLMPWLYLFRMRQADLLIMIKSLKRRLKGLSRMGLYSLTK